MHKFSSHSNLLEYSFVFIAIKNATTHADLVKCQNRIEFFIKQKEVIKEVDQKHYSELCTELLELWSDAYDTITGDKGVVNLFASLNKNHPVKITPCLN